MLNTCAFGAKFNIELRHGESSGSARALACRLRRPRRNELVQSSKRHPHGPFKIAALLKVRVGGAPTPAREARALPRFSQASARSTCSSPLVIPSEVEESLAVSRIG